MQLKRTAIEGLIEVEVTLRGAPGTAAGVNGDDGDEEAPTP